MKYLFCVLRACVVPCVGTVGVVPVCNMGVCGVCVSTFGRCGVYVGAVGVGDACVGTV